MAEGNRRWRRNRDRVEAVDDVRVSPRGKPGMGAGPSARGLKEGNAVVCDGARKRAERL